MCLKHLVCLLVLSLTSCYVPQDFSDPQAHGEYDRQWNTDCIPITLVVSEEFDSDSYRLIQDAAEYWNSLLGTKTLYTYRVSSFSPRFARDFLEESSISKCGLVYMYPAPPPDLPFPMVGATTLDTTDTSPWLIETGTVRISDLVITEDNRFLVIAHELGHVLGILHHSKDPTDLMSPSIGDSTLAITPQELHTARRFSLSP